MSFEQTAKACALASVDMRKDIIKMTYNCHNTGAHIGGALSCVEILACLYTGGILNINADKPTDESRNRFIFSKGHGVLAQYAAMKQIGILSEEDLQTFKQNETRLYAHPSRNKELGIDFSTGSLGQGLSLGVGAALGLKLKNSIEKVYVLMGDGECNEGAVFEAALSAVKFKLNNLVAIIDCNKLQYDGDTNEILHMDLESIWKSIGWHVIKVNGHNTADLLNAFNVKSDMPLLILAETVKGHGVSFMENIPQWHNGRLNDSDYEKAMSEQENSI